MKIAFIIDDFPKISETFILNQITGLLDRGHDVQIFADHDPDESKTHSDVEHYNLRERTQYARTPKNKPRRTLNAMSLLATDGLRRPRLVVEALDVTQYGRQAISLRLLHSVTSFSDEDFDVIHCHFGPNGNVGAALKQAGVSGKLVTMFHGYDVRLGFKRDRDIYSPAFEHSDELLVNSTYNRENLIKLGANPDRITVHPIGVDVNRFAYQEQNDTDSSPIKILTVGRLVEEKGYKYGIAAIDRLVEMSDRDVEYRIVGSGPLEKDLRRAVADQGLDDTVWFMGSRSRGEVIDIMGESDVFCLPSINEGFGAVLLEAQAVGLPIVATSVGGIPEAVNEGKSARLVPKRDSEALAAELRSFVENPDKRNRVGKAARRYVEENYDIKDLNDRLVDIYRRS